MAATHHAQVIKRDSQTYLTTALFQLLETTDLKRITVTQVVKRAGVSRMAFYRNFTTLDDLLRAYFEPAIAARFRDVSDHVPADQKLATIGAFFTEFAPMLRLATERGFEHIIRTAFDQNMTAFYQVTLAQTALTSAQRTYWTRFMSAGVYAIWREWLLDGQREPLTTIHDLIGTFQTATMRALIGGGNSRGD
ncbi:TetR/AcrR family transcriptional regulator [Levilactobacillus spicheri]|uniref:TetR family transcriptional regulator n=2 Tax=Levilactobacillus spicheri TaxID=216463 RepID=A0ABQ0WNY2_9LACO|nr:TetR family transcriptional regulator [Levilactobacillus spicheri]KRL50668.1 transcription regulator [Levilactobacillus spicheri DSM 15429]GEO66803.1 TetR family transcriptional regulator [Levilactobacillus spicheri]